MVESLERQEREAVVYKPTEIILLTPEEVDTYAANRVTDLVERKANAVILFPTDRTSKGMYELLVKAHKDGLDFSKITAINLDNLWPVPRNHPGNYEQVMSKQFYQFVNIPEEHRIIPDGDAENPRFEALRLWIALDNLKKQGSEIDLAVLGIGTNGHIAFNEPGASIDNYVTAVRLFDSSREANAAPFGSAENVPPLGITLGVGKILEANEIMLLAKGSAKADILKQAFRGPVTSEVPASYLQLHPRMTIVTDQEAGAQLLAA